MSSLILKGINHCEPTNTIFGGSKTTPAFSDSTIGTARGIDMSVIITFLVVGILGGVLGLTPAGAYALIGIGTIVGVALIIKALYDRRDALSRLCTCGESEEKVPTGGSTHTPPTGPAVAGEQPLTQT